ncbi:MAG: hypothetical protein QOC83_6037 [Pseudonocardiales bacterium]|jgi:hypothetical protein|nr:hypothetical protein [Pseudonocardiales bacterium]
MGGMTENTENTDTRTEIRASDAEREQTADLIRQAAAEGRLTMAELEERLTTTYGARLRHELPPLVADLPAPPRSTPAGPESRRLSSWDRAALGLHAALVAALVVAVLARWVAGGAVFFWPVFPIFWAVLSLVVHARLRRFGSGYPRWTRAGEPG